MTLVLLSSVSLAVTMVTNGGADATVEGSPHQATVRRLYRAVKKNPPSEKDYTTRQERQGEPPPDKPPEVRRSWDALSFFDTAEGVRQKAAEVPAIGNFVAEYDIPEGIGVTIEPSVEPGHYDVRGDKEALKGCWTGKIEPI